VPRSEIDDLYLVRPYYIVPDGKVGHDAYPGFTSGTALPDDFRLAFLRRDRDRMAETEDSGRRKTLGRGGAASTRQRFSPPCAFLRPSSPSGSPG